MLPRHRLQQEVRLNGPLIVIGYWASDHDDPSWIHPAVLPPSGLSQQVRALLVQHLQNGAHVLAELGMAHNRFRDGPRDLGSAELTDGAWMWPEGLAWYVEHHDVPLPSDFVAHVERAPLRDQAPDFPCELEELRVDLEPWGRWCTAWREALGVMPRASRWKLPRAGGRTT